MTDNPKPARRRRRVVRTSDAVDYDRTADSPRFNSAFDDDGQLKSRVGDGERAVELDEHGDDTPEGDAFWREQIPPHFGGES